MKRVLSLIIVAIFLFAIACQPKITDAGATESTSAAATLQTEAVVEQPSETPAPETVSYASRIEEIGSFEDPERLFTILYRAPLFYSRSKVDFVSCFGKPVLENVVSIDALKYGLYGARQMSEEPNATGLLTIEGEMLIPYETFMITRVSNINTDMDSDRYLEVIYTTGTTEDKNECFVYSTASMLSLSPSEGDTLYTGFARIYDQKKERFVNNVTITNGDKYAVTACGDNFTVAGEDGVTTLYDADGKCLFQTNAFVKVGNGIILVRDSGTYHIVDAMGTKVYTSKYDLDLLRGPGGYFCSRNNDKYTVFDRKGRELFTWDNYVSQGAYGLFSASAGDDKHVLLSSDGSVVAEGDFTYTEHGRYYYTYTNLDEPQNVLLLDGKQKIYEGVFTWPGLKTESKESNKFIIPADGSTLTFGGWVGRLDDNGKFLAIANNADTGMLGLFDLSTGEQLLPYEYEEIVGVPGYLFAYKDNLWHSFRISSVS